DADVSDTHAVSYSGTAQYGTFSLGSKSDTSNGVGGSQAWSYSVDESKVQYLAQGQQVSETFTISVDDGHGSVKSQDVVITLTGTEDAVVITSGPQTGSLNEDGAVASASGAVTFSDADVSDTH